MGHFNRDENQYNADNHRSNVPVTFDHLSHTVVPIHPTSHGFSMET